MRWVVCAVLAVHCVGNAQAVTWVRFDPLQDLAQLPVNPELVLIALTNNVDQAGNRRRSTEEGFWAKGPTDETLLRLTQTQPNLVKRLRFEYANLGLPPELTGGRVTTRPERIIFVVCDRDYRLLSMAIGVLNLDQMTTLIEDAYETRALMDTESNGRARAIEMVSERTFERVDEYYGNRLQVALDKLRQSDAGLGRMAPQQVVAANGVVEANGALEPKQTPEQSFQSEKEENAVMPAATEGQFGQKLENASSGDEKPTTDAEPEKEEWESAGNPDAWKAAVEDLEIDQAKNKIAEFELTTRLALVERAITDRYRVDVRRRYGSAGNLTEVSLWILEQHPEAKFMWCQCATPLLLGIDFRRFWRPIVEQTWEGPVARYVPLSPEFLDWWAEHEDHAFTLSFNTPWLKYSASGDPGMDVSPRRTGRRATREDLQTAMQSLAVQTVSLDVVATLQQTGRIRPLDVLAPSPVTDLVLAPKHSKLPIIVRRDDPASRHLARVRRWATLEEKETP